MHDTLTLTASGLALGVLTHTVWARSNTRGAGKKARRKKSIREKESRKWIDALEECARLTPKGVRDVTICDAESDVFELFAAGQRLQKELLVRACQDRCLLGQGLKLWDFMASQPVKGYLQIDVPPSDKGARRKATVTVQFADIALKAPRHAKAEMQQQYPSIAVTAIYVKELHPPADVKEPLEWMLLTTVATQTLEDATQRIEWYKLRWKIEIFHKVLKSGCNVEKVQFETAERIKRYLALFVAIAYRILWIRDISRVCPDAPCTVVLAPAVLSSRLGSASLARTITVFVIVPLVPAFTVTRRLNTPRPPEASVPNDHTPVALLYEPGATLCERYVTPAGSVSVTRTFVAVFGPRLFTRMV